MNNFMDSLAKTKLQTISKSLYELYGELVSQRREGFLPVEDYKLCTSPLFSGYEFHICTADFRELKTIKGEDLSNEQFEKYKRYRECKEHNTIRANDNEKYITHVYLAPPIKPLMTIHVFGLDYITGKRIQQTFTKYFSDRYDIVILDNVVNVKTDNMISINVDKSTNVDKLIESIENHFNNIKEA